ncbi:MAG TPA: phosphodiester glycosidase family protein [Candidatus Eremiobacteraceae bacterium]|nr:phosphodiester glycosidase family protein [Candidatus Eremiobacteraceae bacterium]
MSFRAALLITAFGAALFCTPVPAGAREEPVPSASVQSTSTFPQPLGWPRVLGSTVSEEQVGPGVTYQRWLVSTDAGPMIVSLARIDLRNPYVALTVETHNHQIIGKGERLSSMADRVGAELGVNADYFDINESGSPLNLVAIDQRVVHQPDRAAAFVVDSQNRIQMGSVSWRARLESATGARRDIALVNEWSPSVNLALVTNQLGTDVGGGATEMVLDPSDTAGQLRVARIDANLQRLDTLAPDQFAVVARGAQALSLAHDYHAGDLVTLTTQSDPALNGIKLGVGGGPLLVSGGRLVADPTAPAPEETNVRNPVTGAGLSADGNTLWLVVVDGRQPALSIGLTRPQLAELFIALGANTAMAFDSGGSSEMVIRHLGDPTSSVATTPSDGRERSIADGLFVRNTAPQGPAVSLILKAPSAQVLVGSKIDVQVRAIDANDQPVLMRGADVAFATDPDSVARIDRSGTLTALTPGTVQVTALAANARTSAAIRVVGSVDNLRIDTVSPNIAVNAKIQLSITAASNDGQSIAVDPAAVQWSEDGEGGRIQPDGMFVAGSSAAKVVVTARVGAASTQATLLVGEHASMLQNVPQPGATSGAWHYTARPANLPGGVDASAAPDSSAALRLAYDLSGSTTLRAAYAETELAVPGQPLALAVDVFGDGNGEWLRGGYRNADGNNESLTIARHVDWQGWKTIRVAIPAQAAWPIVWTRFYVVERAQATHERGSLWFRNFRLFFAGP